MDFTKMSPYSTGLFWHGTAGDFDGRYNGIHIGTYLAAKQALEARIGVPADGRGWDGTREYGKTLLAGRATLERLGVDETGYNAGYANHGNIGPLSLEDAYPNGSAAHSNGELVAMTAKPIIFPVRIVGSMLNTPDNPFEDDWANSHMLGQLKRGAAKTGYYYINCGEDSGSLSVVVPSSKHLVRVDLATDEVRFAYLALKGVAA